MRKSLAITAGHFFLLISYRIGKLQNDNLQYQII